MHIIQIKNIYKLQAEKEWIYPLLEPFKPVSSFLGSPGPMSKPGVEGLPEHQRGWS